MPPTWRIDLLHQGGWDWAPGFEMSWMETGAPDGPLAPVSLLLRDGAHHRSSPAVKVATGQDAVIASDCFMRPQNVTENRPLGINESLAETLAAYDRIHREADILIPLYDPGVFQQHPDGVGAAPCAAKSPPRRETPP